MIFAFALALAACGGNESPAPRVLVRLPANAILLGAADGRVFWSEDAVLHWVGEPGLTAGSVPLVGLDRLHRVGSFVDATGVYYLHGDALETVQVAADGRSAAHQPPRVVVAHPGGLARHRDCLYVLDVDVDCKGNGALVGLPLVEGARCRRHGIVVEGTPLRPFAANDRRFVWVNGGCERPTPYYEDGIFSLDPDSGYIETAVEKGTPPNELQLGVRDTYWRSPTRLLRASSATGLSPQVVVDLPVLAFVVDRDTIFYSDGTGVHAVAEEAIGRPRQLAAAPRIEQLAVDARYLYWVTSIGDLVRLPRR